MNKDQLFEKFKELFPNWADKVISYRKIGSRTLAIVCKSEDGDFIPSFSRVFLYINDSNWHFGTKLWRKRPDRVSKRLQETSKLKEGT